MLVGSAERTTAEELAEYLSFSIAWQIRLLFKITTHRIASHERIHQGGRVCNVQCFENRTEILPKAYNYG